MTKFERLQHVLHNEPVDYTPVALFHHFTGPEAWNNGLHNEAAFEQNIAGHAEALKKFDPDLVKIMNDTLMMMEIDVSFVQKAEDLRRIRVPGVGSPFFEKTRELVQRVIKIYEGCGAPIYFTGFSPVMVLRNCVSGMDLGTEITSTPKLVQYMQEDPDSVVCALNMIADSVMDLNTMVIKECGVDGIYMSVNNQAHYFPDEMYAQYVVPIEQRIMLHAKGLSDINLLHICGYHGFANNLQLFKDYEAAGFNWAVHAEGISLSEGKKIFGGKPVFGGFEQTGVIYTGTREEVEAATRQILDEAGQVGIMIGADCTVPTDIDDDRLNWVREESRKYAAEHQ